MKNVQTELTVTPKNVIMGHLGSFLNNDMVGVMSDYTDESVLITQEATYVGKEEIKGFFDSLIVHFPKQGSAFELDKIVVRDELVFIVWHAKTPAVEVSMGTDTFIVKNGKIWQQTFAGQLSFIN